VCTAMGLYGLYRYHGLSKEKRAEADRVAVSFARELYGKALDQLTSQQVSRVNEVVKGHFAA